MKVNGRLKVKESNRSSRIDFSTFNNLRITYPGRMDDTIRASGTCMTV
jgi:hypothetical protein